MTPLPFLYVLLAAPSTASDSSFELNYLGMSFLGGFFRGLVDPLSRTLVLLLTPRGLQGASASILIVVMELGRALGPTVVAEMTASSHVGQGRREQAFAYALLLGSGPNLVTELQQASIITHILHGSVHCSLIFIFPGTGLQWVVLRKP